MTERITIEHYAPLTKLFDRGGRKLIMEGFSDPGTVPEILIITYAESRGSGNKLPQAVAISISPEDALALARGLVGAAAEVVTAIARIEKSTGEPFEKCIEQRRGDPWEGVAARNGRLKP